MSAFVALAAVSAVATANPWVRPGYRLVNGVWVKPEARVPIGDILQFIERNRQQFIWARPSEQLEPKLRNGRAALIEIVGNPLSWKLSVAGRQWNEDRTAGTQHLQLIAAPDDLKLQAVPQLTQVIVNPGMTLVEAVAVADEQPTRVRVLFIENRVEMSIGPLKRDAPPNVVYAAPSLRLMHRQHPDDSRTFLLPILTTLNGGTNPLHPAAGDVYRVLSNLSPDPAMTTAIDRLLPRLAHRDPTVRRQAADDLSRLGRPGVLAAMRYKRAGVPLEAAARLRAFVREHVRDSRDAASLGKDPIFLTDCLHDPDPAVRAEAARLLAAIQQPQDQAADVAH